jgi:hypothetical protein
MKAFAALSTTWGWVGFRAFAVPREKVDFYDVSQRDIAGYRTQPCGLRCENQVVFVVVEEPVNPALVLLAEYRRVARG